MSMSSAQSTAFQTASGFTPSATTTLFVGFALTLAYLWAGWAIYSAYKGWATKNLDRNIAAASAIRAVVLCMILTAFVLS